MKHHLKISRQEITIESDWSSASYLYSIVALSKRDTRISLKSFFTDSLQGDSVLAEIYKQFGVETVYENKAITLIKTNSKLSKINLNLIKTPDIAQTVAVCCFGLGIACTLSGLHTLKIKETDRLVALKIEIEKLGGQVQLTDDSLHLMASKSIKEDIKIKTYNDHRMAMAFAPLVLKVPINILEPNVVTKSYATFWKDLLKIGVKAQLK